MRHFIRRALYTVLVWCLLCTQFLFLSGHGFPYALKDEAVRYHSDSIRAYTPSEAEVAIQSPWWRAGWVFMAFTLLFVGLGVAWSRFLKWRWELRMELKQNQQEAIRLQELDDLKNRLYTNQLLDLAGLDASQLKLDLVQMDVLPFILHLTALCKDEATRSQEGAGPTKPFDRDELLVGLQALLEQQQLLRAHFAQKETAIISTPNAVEEVLEVEDAFLQKVRAIVETHYQNESFALPQLCKQIGMSRSQLYRKMKVVANVSPSDFIRDYRLKKAKKLLETSNLSVSEVAWKVGYKEVAHFSVSYKNAFNELPSAT